MAFSIRKKVSVGLLHFDLTDGTIAVSGMRLGTKPSGNYVKIDGTQASYHQSQPFARSGHARPPAVILPNQPRTPAMQEIESGDVANMVDSSFAKLLTEMNDRRAKLSFAPVVLLIGVTAAALAYEKVHPGISALVVAILYGVARVLDTQRKTTVVMYDFEGEGERRFKALHAAFERLSAADRIWHVDASGRVASQDRKYQAGATSVVQRQVIQLSCEEPKFLRTNVPIPTIPVGRQTLYLLPDHLLVVEGSTVGALNYASIQADVSQTNFIESDGVPRDAQVAGSTWRYVNKSGGPDRRFKDNPTIPIARYEELHLRSSSGLNELLQISRIGLGQGFAEQLRA